MRRAPELDDLASLGRVFFHVDHIDDNHAAPLGDQMSRLPPSYREAWESPEELRWLASNSTSSNSSGGGNSTMVNSDDGEVLRDTFLVYGIVLCVLVSLFCFARLRYPRAYTIRRWTDDSDLKTPLANDQYGYISWIWRLWEISEEEIRTQCGLDSLCFLRVLRLGFIMSVIGMFNAIWLMPLYATAADSPETSSIVDGIAKVTIAHVPSSSKRLAGTVLAAYILIGCTLALILRELRWFGRQRHAYLSELTARNYTVYVRNIPVALMSNAAVEQYFRHSFPSSVLQAHLRVKAPNLTKLVSQRDSLVSKLEHAIAQEQKSGRTLTHCPSSIFSRLSGGDGTRARRVNTIDHYSSELLALNQNVSERIDVLQSGTLQSSSTRLDAPRDSERGLGDGSSWHERQPRSVNSSETSDRPTVPDSFSSSQDSVRAERVPLSNSGIDGEENNSSKPSSGGVLQSLASVKSQALSAAATPFQAATSLLLGPTEGEMHSAGFVTFKKLSAVQSTLQTVQNEEPFAMQVVEAPDPNDVMWSNVGRSHKDLQGGLLLSMSATIAICLLWTIPMAFLASLSSVGALKDTVPFIAELLEAAPFLEPVFQLLAPLLVPIVNSLLPAILGFLSSLEGPVSASLNGASTFGKLASFMIIQTFFVSAISGGILQELTNILNNPTSIVDLLANSLPSQATYFIQIVFIGTVVMVGLELLRVTPIAFAAIRRRVGPRLTDKEKSSPFLCFRPLSSPSDFPHADLLSQVVLYFTVQLVYAVIAPITSFVLAFCFLYMGAAYRHQMVYIYPRTPDSGGKLWTRFIGILISCIIIAEITVLGLLLLKKSVLAVPLMLPLIVVTGLFSAYIRQEHFRVANHLPLRECSQVDQQRSEEDFAVLFKDAYVQPELQTRVLYPEAEPGQSLPRLLLPPGGGDDDDELRYFTPNPSEAMTDASLRSDDPLHPRACLAPPASHLGDSAGLGEPQAPRADEENDREEGFSPEAEPLAVHMQAPATDVESM